MKSQLNKLIVSLKKKRSQREQFFLRGSKLCYTAREKDVDQSEIKNRLSQLMGDNTYYDYYEDKIQTRKINYNDIEVFDALFCVYDITVLFSEDLPAKTSDKIQTLIHRIYSSSDILSGSRARKSLLYDISHSSEPSNEDSFQIKVSDLEMCMLGQDDNTNNLARTNCEVEEDLLHELFISFLFTNRLRKIVPNFQLCYAGLKFNRSNKVDSNINEEKIDCSGICPCDTTQTVDYLLQEKINGNTMSEELKTCSLNEYLSWMTQIILALELGVIHFGFTHNNLHTDNIIISPISQTSNTNSSATPNGEIIIPYFHNNDILYVRAVSIAVISNFELAHVKHMYTDIEDDGENIINKSEHFGPIGFAELGIFHNETRPFYDIYKVLMWSLNILKKHNEKVYTGARKISKFFGFEYEYRLEAALKDEEKLTYIYNTISSDLEKTRSIRDLLDLMFREFSEMNTLVTRKSKLVEAKSTKLQNLISMGSRLSLPNTTQYNLELSARSNNKLNGFSVLKCNGYCPISGFTSEDFKSSISNITDTHTNANVILTVEDLKIFSMKDILERCHGLRKRTEELTRLTYGFCKISNVTDQNTAKEIKDSEDKKKLCQPTSEELLEATNEFKQFEVIISTHKSKLYLDAAKEIEMLVLDVNSKVRINNVKLAMYREQSSKEQNNMAREMVCRDREIIAGKTVMLTDKILTINHFRELFEISDIIFKVNIEASNKL